MRPGVDVLLYGDGIGQLQLPDSELNLTVLKQWNGTTADQKTHELSDLKLPTRAQVGGPSTTEAGGSSDSTRGGVVC